MKTKLFLAMVLLTSVITYAQDVSFTFENPRNVTIGTDDFFEVDIFATSTAGFIFGDASIRYFYNTAAFGEAVETNNILETFEPAGSLYGSGALGGAIPQFQILNIANTLDSFTVTYATTVSSGTFGANTVTSTPTHLYSIRLKYIDVNEDPQLTFSTEASDTDQVFIACGPFDIPATGFAFVDCVGSPGPQLAATDISFTSGGATLSVSDFSRQIKDNNVFLLQNEDVLEVQHPNNLDFSAYSIFNIAGVEVVNGNTKEINTTSFSPGIYIAVLEFDTGIIVKKFAK